MIKKANYENVTVNSIYVSVWSIKKGEHNCILLLNVINLELEKICSVPPWTLGWCTPFIPLRYMLNESLSNFMTMI